MAREKLYTHAILVTLLLLFFGRVAQCITCLSCQGEEGVGSLSDCREIKECDQGQTCYVEKFLSLQTYLPRFTAGCRDVHECNLIKCNHEIIGKETPAPRLRTTTASPPVGKRSELVICTECCYNNTCNTMGCGANFSVGDGHELTQCYQCPIDREDKPPCTDFGICQLHEICATQYVLHEGLPQYLLGCMHQEKCKLLDKIAEMNNEPSSSECCNGHLCNASPIQRDNISETVFQQLACPTDLVQTTTTPKPTTTTTTTTPKPTTTTTTPNPTTTTITPKPTTTTTTPQPTTTTTPQPITTTPQPTTTTTPKPTTTTTPQPTTTTPQPTTTTTPKPTTSTTPQPTTTTPQPTTTTTPAPTTTTPAPTTTPTPTTTPPPKPTKCQVCSGPPMICERLHHEETCTYPNNYCINHLVNHDTGARELTRRCGNIDTCVHEWYQGTSDNDRCTTFDPKFVQTLDFECTFCCTTDNCNENVVPDKTSLFKNES